MVLCSVGWLEVESTQTDTTIHCTSNHHTEHKTMAYSNMLHRYKTLPITQQATYEEYNTLN